MKRFFCILLLFVAVGLCRAQPPTRLTTDLLEHTDRVFLDGYPAAGLTLPELGLAVERYQLAALRNPKPFLGWVVNSDRPNTLQTAYRILVASSEKLLAKDKADIWDSGRTQSDNSVAVPYGGKPLRPSTVYYWKVKTWDNHGVESDFSQVKSFITAAKLEEGAVSRYPLTIEDEHPVKISVLEKGRYYIDFEKAAFGRLKLTLTSANGNETVTVRLGERVKNGQVDRAPGGSIRYSAYRLPLMKGTHTYTIKIRPNRRNTNVAKTGGAKPILMPDYIGEVTPFRCCEIENYHSELKITDVVRHSVSYPFDETASMFNSSDAVLNRVWELCKHAIKATSFAGTYIDGDRERIPYEREALISQLGHYCVDREFALARHSHEYLIQHPTWPTEWIMQSVWMAWNDYMYTGNAASLNKCYEDLKAKTLLGLKDGNGLISTKTGKMTPRFLKTIYFNDKAIRDIVDWPHTGILGLGKGELGETDGFVFKDYNVVVNAYHYWSLCQMAQIAEVTGRADDAAEFRRLSEQHKKDFNRLFFDAKRGRYKDGTDTDHSSLHANMFPLAFGLVPEKNIKGVLDYVRSRGMACSISGALVLMEALYNNNDAAYALKLLASTAERGWYNTIRIGATLTLEAWDNKYKPNLDWNQSAGSSPASIIPRKLMGIEPLEAGFRKIRIKPQPATLRHAEIKMPSVRGDIYVSFDNQPGKEYALEVEIPANSVAEVWVPLFSKKYNLAVDGVSQKGTVKGGFVTVEIGSGRHKIGLRIAAQTAKLGQNSKLKRNPETSFYADFGKGKAGGLPEGWTLNDFENAKAPRIVLKKDGLGNYLSLSGNGDPVGVAYLSAKTKLAPGTYSYKALFSISEEVNPQRNLLFQCKATTHDGIHKFYRLDKGMVEGRGTIVVTDGKPVPAEIRVFYRLNARGEVKLRSLSLTPTEPVQPNWVRFACTKGNMTMEQIPLVAAQAARDKADLLLYPEHVSQGSGDASRGEEVAQLLSGLAAQYKMYIAASVLMIDKSDGRKYNRGVLYDRRGQLIGVYDKIHPYSPEINNKKVAPGTKTDVFKTDFGTVGMIVCYDSWFTDITELLALKGAKVILFPVAGYYRSIIPARASDNGVRFVISELGSKYGIFDTAGRDVQNPDKDGSVGIRKTYPPTFREVRTFDITEKVGLLCADLDMNCTVSPHYNGGTMLESPGGKRNRADQILYLDDMIKKEKERWWEE
jgi:predicted amidohydrolase